MPDEHDHAVQELAAEWMRRARADLAVTGLVEDERLAPEILAFHAQQAAEKALKALLVARQIDFQRTHNIQLLLNLCQTAGFAGAETLSDAATLTPYAVITRYPYEEEPMSRQEAREAANAATATVMWVEQHLSSQS